MGVKGLFSTGHEFQLRAVLALLPAEELNRAVKGWLMPSHKVSSAQCGQLQLSCLWVI